MLIQQQRSPHEAILCVRSPTEAAVRMGDWKLLSRSAPPAGNDLPKARAKKLKKRPPEPLELYNLAIDIGETTNLVDKDPERVAVMKAKLAELLRGAVPSGAPSGPSAE